MSPELQSRHEPRKRLRPRPALIIAGVSAAALLGGASVANAASASRTPPSAAPAAAIAGASRILAPSDSHPGAGPFTGMHGAGPAGWPLPVHGKIVLTKPGGGYQTVYFQHGTVTKVDSTSITLKSADGFTQSYSITGSTLVTADRGGIGSVIAGNDAVVVATVSGHTATAARIIDLTQLLHSHQQFGLVPSAHP
jgi:hypothetical protein